MRKRKKGCPAFPCLAALALLLSCHKEPPPEPPPEPQQSVPLAVGNWWIYQDVANPGRFDTTTVLYDTTYNGYQAFAVLGYLMGNYDTSIVYYADSNLNMVYTFTLSTISLTVEGVLMPEFLATGQRWKVGEDSITGIHAPPFFDSTDLIILSIWGQVIDSVLLSAPAGEFDPAFVIHYEDSLFKNSRDNFMFAITTYSWVCPATGIVARDEDGDGQVIPTALLWDYQLLE